jgi:hypothetical protein
VPEPVELPRSGSFVTEVGIRQAWLFLTFSSGAPTPSEEIRLFLDTNWTLGATRFNLDVDELESGLLTLCKLVNRTLANDAGTSGANLVLDFDDYEELQIDGSGASTTTHDVWWLAKTVPPQQL